MSEQEKLEHYQELARKLEAKLATQSAKAKQQRAAALLTTFRQQVTTNGKANT